MGLETIITPLRVIEEEDIKTRNFRIDLFFVVVGERTQKKVYAPAADGVFLTID